MKIVKLCISELTAAEVLRGVAVLAASAGCGVDAPDGVEEVQAVQAVTVRDFRDASGQVTVRIKQCDPTMAQHAPTATCSVDSDFVLVGGGGEIVGDGNPGALLYASFPDNQLTTWTAQSKDHDLSFLHQLRAYAIGLKLENVSAGTLRGRMQVFTVRSGRFEHPGAVEELPFPEFLMIGGGARANWTTSGQLLTTSIPTPSGAGWFAASKDHVVAEVGTVDTFAIGIRNAAIPGFGSLSIVSTSAQVSSPSGYSAANVAVPAGWVVTSIGGDATFSGAGRMLTDMVPFVDVANSLQGATIRSKDHEVRDTGATTACVTVVRAAQ